MNEVADRVQLAVDGAGPAVLTTLVAVLGVGALLGLAFYVWYALALSKLFARLGVEGWKGWVPILNEATILTLGGKPAWNVVFYFIPIVQIYGLIVKIQAVHGINGRFGRGAGSTVLAVLLPPVWASILAWGAPPYPEGDRLAALQPGPRRQGQPQDAPPHDSSKGYLAPPILPPGGESAHGEPASFAPAAPAAAAPPAFVSPPPAMPNFERPATASTPAAPQAAPTFAPPAPPAAPAAPPAAPTLATQAPSFAPPAPASPSVAPGFPPVDAPAPAPAYPDAPVPSAVDAAPASLIVGVPGVERAEPAESAAPPASSAPPVSPAPPVSSAPPVSPSIAPTAAHDVDGLPGAAEEASDPVLETLPQPPARAAGAAEEPAAPTTHAGTSDDPHVSAGSLPDRLGAAPAPDARAPRFTAPAPVPVVLPVPEPSRPSPAFAEIDPHTDAEIDIDQTLSGDAPLSPAPVSPAGSGREHVRSAGSGPGRSAGPGPRPGRGRVRSTGPGRRHGRSAGTGPRNRHPARAGGVGPPAHAAAVSGRVRRSRRGCRRR
ncbi:DUF5684 domain-containing protein [Microbacterium foliorum]|uniref:Uncharacterized protein n=1 Tax=Microbacterium foliorum TaxID=104336 RepID=A0A0F0KGU0_9MICO|nr:DUF5684 domain-containing protein [Microbacterium foliorum]KJL19350.1 hypothetical protein RN50_02635 [Microbacterium foliorum]